MMTSRELFARYGLAIIGIEEPSLFNSEYIDLWKNNIEEGIEVLEDIACKVLRVQETNGGQYYNRSTNWDEERKNRYRECMNLVVHHSRFPLRTEKTSDGEDILLWVENTACS